MADSEEERDFAPTEMSPVDPEVTSWQGNIRNFRAVSLLSSHMEWSNTDEFTAALVPLAGRKLPSSLTAVYGIRKPPELAKSIFLIGVPYALRSALI